ncbi:MAG: hypothetical protein ACQES8_04755 [Thermodesulfobacteriota bacterium]
MENIIKLSRSLALLIVGIITLLALAATPEGTVAAEWAVAEGSGETGSEAIHDAQRNAVQQELGVMLSSETMVENFTLIQDRILTRVKGYVKKYEVISKKCTDICQVKIKAQVEKMALADDVAILCDILPRLNYPSLVTIVEQKTVGKSNNLVSSGLTTVEKIINKNLMDKGFRVANSAALKARRKKEADLLAATGNELGQALETASSLAQIMINCQALAEDNGPSPYNERIHSYSATLTADVYETSTGRILASTVAEANTPHISFTQGTQEAMKMAAAKLSGELSGKIIQSWLDACYNPHDVIVTVEKIDFSGLRKIKMAMADINGIERVNQKNYLRGRAELVVGWLSCNTMRLAERLDQLKVGGKLVHVLAVEGNNIRVAYSR